MEKGSVYCDNTPTRVPRSIHLVGIGRSGCQLIEAFLRTGYLEDSLGDPIFRVTTLAVDIGEKDILHVKDNYGSFMGRMKGRGIPPERVQLRAVALPVPEKDELSAVLKKYPEYLKREYPVYQKNPNFVSWIPDDQPLPAAGEHIPRAIAKAIYGKAYYHDKILDKELNDFADSVNASSLPPMVFIAFGFAGGTGSGIAVDLARHLANIKMPGIQICGIGFLPCDGDPEELRGANLYPTFNEIDMMMDASKNAAITGLWGDLYRNPFTAGFMMVPLQPAWERLSKYSETWEKTTKKGKPRLKGWQHAKIKVTTKFADDCLAKTISEDNGREFLRMMAPMGVCGPWHECGARMEKSFSIFSINKLIHPAVAVVLGEPLDVFREEIRQMIPESLGAIPLKEGFKTVYMECHVHAPRGMWTKTLDEILSEGLLPYVEGNRDNLGMYHHEAFDLLNCYAFVTMPGISRKDITYFTEARDKYETLDEETQKLLMHSFLLELGVMVSEPSQTVENLAGKSLWGDPYNTGIQYDVITGRAEEVPDLGILQSAGAAPLVPLAARVR